MSVVPEPSPEILRTAVVVMCLSSVGLALGVYFLMQIRHLRNLSWEARRLTFANLIVPPWDGKSLNDLWVSSNRQDREIIEEVLAGQRQFLEGPEADAFEHAVVGSSIYAHWCQQLRSGPAFQRIRAARLLGHFHDPRGIEALAAATKNPSPGVALACVLSLGRLKSPAGLLALMALTHISPSVIPDPTLASALAACSRECPSRLMSLLSSADVRSRVIGAWALSEVSDASVLTPLLRAARDLHPEVRAKVARALARIPDRASVDALMTLARDPVWFVRVRALDALGTLCAPASEPAVLVALADEVREVRYRAAFALRKIGGMKSEVVIKVLTLGSRSSFDSLMSEWERAGFLYSVAESLSGHDWVRLEESEEFLRILISSGVTNALVNLVQVFPNIKIRLRLLRLLLEAPDHSVQDELLALADDPGCDRRVAAAIRARIHQATSDTPSEVGLDTV